MRKMMKMSLCALLAVLLLLSVALLAGCSKAATVPDVTGMSLADAEKAVQDQGLTLTVNRERYSKTTPKGDVDQMLTPAGEELEKGGEVKVITSLGRGVTVPNVWLLTDREAANLIAKVGLNPVIKEEYSDDVEKGNIIDCTDSGCVIDEGSDVILTVSLGPEPKG